MSRIEPHGDVLAVWGSPIGHSRSPLLHRTAYDVLGLDWSYGRREVDETGFATAFAQRTPRWRGLSLTMPVKSLAFAAADRRDRTSELTGASNTLAFTDEGIVAANTDVAGMVLALADRGVTSAGSAAVLGGGATAASALCALAAIGVTEVALYLRNARRAAELTPLADRLGIALSPRTLDALPSGDEPLLVSTLPGPAQTDLELSPGRFRGVAVLDVAYDPWPSRIAALAAADGSSAASGLDMLVHQAVAQIRLFLAGTPDERLPDEAAVTAAMFRAVGRPVPAR
ncbi:shikimate dehydrogenase family protein [Mycetocola reblochoni]|uniref:Shikimate 5-dehydrogenase I alpha n=2 Tax=Mycetocola reblochoni TaxID=331618 RepID=A0A1R4J4M1_9MICO|nr:hypothetical protein [Mycetocola reblochoni]RLP69504.1 shikimate dehydrogenase [Mycetocola reblochoni]SJN26653.1 Shikimate 5-dehydrogenase I alpha [Mycetocola reblochoni REB411]